MPYQQTFNTWKIAFEANDFAKQFLPIKEMDKSWRDFFVVEHKKPYFKKMYKDLKKEYSYCIDNNIKIYPQINQIFQVFKLCPLNKIKVVVLGQDPYINERNVKIDGNITRIPEACGLAFSVSNKINPPASLKNIYKELNSDDDVQFNIPKSGNLTNWVHNQGVFLLNCALSVRAGKSNSHAKYWQEFTENVIKYISDNTNNVVFILWGRFAQSKKSSMNQIKHCIIESSHPSPMSANSGFFGSKCFSQCNKYLEKYGFAPVNWNDIP